MGVRVAVRQGRTGVPACCLPAVRVSCIRLIPVSVWPFAVIVVMVVFNMNRDSQTVQARCAGGFRMKVERFRKKGVDRLLDGEDVCAQRGEGGKDHVAAGAAHAVEPDKIFHVSSLQGMRLALQRKKGALTDLDKATSQDDT